MGSNVPPLNEGTERLLTPQDVADLVGQWLELAAPPFTRRKAAGVDGRLLTTREVAELLRLSPHTVLRWASKGKIPAIKLPNGALRFREDEVAEWLESRSQRG